MKKFSILIILTYLLLPKHVFGQSFFEKDTKYVLWTRGGGQGDYFTFQEVYLDSISSGYEFYHVLNSIGNSTSKFYYKVKDKKVYTISNLFRYRSNDYHLIYDFNLNAGDSLIIDTIFSKQIYKHRIDSVKTLKINGKSKKVQFVTVILQQNETKYTFIEGIGCIQTGLWFYEGSPSIPEIEYSECLRICMNDTAYLPKLKNNSLDFLETPCMSDSLRKKISVKEFNTNKFLIYPNPIKDELTIENFTGEIELFDITGSLAMQENIKQTKTLNVKALPIGIYYLKAGNDKGSKVYKVLKL